MISRIFVLACWTGLVASLVSGHAAEPAAEHWLLVTAPAFRDALEPLREHRQGQGMKVRVLQTTDVLSAEELQSGDVSKLREKINELCRDFRGSSYVLLVGTATPDRAEGAARRLLPALPGTVSRMKGQPSDNGYGCLGDDLLPSVAVGRWPARTEEEAKGMVRKTLAFERDSEPGEWRRRMTVLAGIPAFNPLVDKLVETLAMGRFDKLDPSWTGKAIYHNQQSRFCVPDEQLHDRALEYVQEGQALTLYLGHSDPRGFYAGQARFLDRDDWAALKIRRGQGVFATFGCNGCQLAGRHGEGYGVAAIRNPQGPVAALGSQGICFAAMVQVAADGFFEALLSQQSSDRLGQAWLGLKRGLAKGKIDDFSFHLLDAVDGDSKIPQATQRLEHLEMFVLLGDPALRLPRMAKDVRLQVDGSIGPGKTITVTGEAPERLEGAQVRLTLERAITSEPASMASLPQDKLERSQVMLANHNRANQFVLIKKEAQIQGGRFEARLRLPAPLPWSRLILRAYAATSREEGQGVTVLRIQTVGK